MPDTITGIGPVGQAAHVVFQIEPNPNNGSFSIIYLLPQNEPGILRIYNLKMQNVQEMQLPKGSTMQYVTLPDLDEGLYQALITSGGYRKAQKVAVMRQ